MTWVEQSTLIVVAVVVIIGVVSNFSARLGVAAPLLLAVAEVLVLPELSRMLVEGNGGGRVGGCALWLVLVEVENGVPDAADVTTAFVGRAASCVRVCGIECAARGGRRRRGRQWGRGDKSRTGGPVP